MTPELKPCPFCNEPDFDLVGLKSHIVNHCETWPLIERIPSFNTRAESAELAALREDKARLDELFRPGSEMKILVAQYSSLDGAHRGYVRLMDRASIDAAIARLFNA